MFISYIGRLQSLSPSCLFGKKITFFFNDQKEEGKGAEARVESGTERKGGQESARQQTCVQSAPTSDLL